MQSHLTVRAVSVHARAAASLDVCVRCMTWRSPAFAGVVEDKVIPVPGGRSGVAELLEERDGNAGLHAMVATLRAVEVLGDDAEGT